MKVLSEHLYRGIILLARALFLRYKDGESVENGSGDDPGKLIY